jgi:hypothetical protein
MGVDDRPKDVEVGLHTAIKCQKYCASEYTHASEYTNKSAPNTCKKSFACSSCYQLGADGIPREVKVGCQTWEGRAPERSALSLVKVV